MWANYFATIIPIIIFIFKIHNKYKCKYLIMTIALIQLLLELVGNQCLLFYFYYSYYYFTHYSYL